MRPRANEMNGTMIPYAGPMTDRAAATRRFEGTPPCSITQRRNRLAAEETGP